MTITYENKPSSFWKNLASPKDDAVLKPELLDELKSLATAEHKKLGAERYEQRFDHVEAKRLWLPIRALIILEIKLDNPDYTHQNIADKYNASGTRSEKISAATVSGDIQKAVKILEDAVTKTEAAEKFPTLKGLFEVRSKSRAGKEQ